MYICIHIHIFIYLLFFVCLFLKQPCNKFLSAEEGSHIFNTDKAARLKVDHMYTMISPP